MILPHAFNVRDLGGFMTKDGKTVRWQKLYRADALCALTEGSVNADTGAEKRKNAEKNAKKVRFIKTITCQYTIRAGESNYAALVNRGIFCFFLFEFIILQEIICRYFKNMKN